MSSRRILIADDEPIIIRMIENNLRRAGLEIDVVAVLRSKEILGRVRSEKPELILLDSCMPKPHTGCVVIQSLLADPLVADIPILLIQVKHATFVRECSREICCEKPQTVSALAQIAKPFHPLQLVSLVKTLLTGGEQPR